MNQEVKRVVEVVVDPAIQHLTHIFPVDLILSLHLISLPQIQKENLVVLVLEVHQENLVV